MSELENASDTAAMVDIPLGKSSEYVSSYDASLLCPIPRQASRRGLSIENSGLPFGGVDIWTGYELSWLDGRGKPQVAVAEFSFPCDSANIVESKSFKLYLNSLNQMRYDSWPQVSELLKADLSRVAAAPVAVRLLPLSASRAPLAGELHHCAQFNGISLDELEVDIVDYQPNPALLEVSEAQVEELLCSDLLKTNCPVTGQPDWASLSIRYSGPQIDREGLLKYIVSYRQHQDFHENSVESIFMDLLKFCRPDKLSVYARYTRRGGLDINPFRSNCGESPAAIRLLRQ